MANRERIASRRLRRKLAAYSLATGTGLLSTDRLDAAVVPYQLPAPLVYDAALGSPSPPIDINADGVSDFYFESQYDQQPDGSYFGSFQIYRTADSPNSVYFIGSYLARIFAPGESIASGDRNNFAFLPADTRGYIGVKFDIPGGSPHHAYLDIETSNPQFLTIYGGAYESQANAPIRAGAVPEPGSLALLAAGATGLATWRRRSNGGAS